MGTRHTAGAPAAPGETLLAATRGGSSLSRRAAWGTLAVLAGLLTLHGCDNVDPIDQAAEHATQQAKENAVEMDDGTAAGPGPVDTQPEPAPDQAGTEDPPQP